jgi:hypothetical protein
MFALENCQCRGNAYFQQVEPHLRGVRAPQAKSRAVVRDLKLNRYAGISVVCHAKSPTCQSDARKCC